MAEHSDLQVHTYQRQCISNFISLKIVLKVIAEIFNKTLESRESTDVVAAARTENKIRCALSDCPTLLFCVFKQCAKDNSFI